MAVGAGRLAHPARLAERDAAHRPPGTPAPTPVGAHGIPYLWRSAPKCRCPRHATAGGTPAFVTGGAARLEAHHRSRARLEDRIRCAKGHGLGRLPSCEFAINHARCLASANRRRSDRLATDPRPGRPTRTAEQIRLRYRLLQPGDCALTMHRPNQPSTYLDRDGPATRQVQAANDRGGNARAYRTSSAFSTASGLDPM